MKPELLATLRAAGEAATAGPWHRGQRIISAGVEPSGLPGLEGTGKCVLCHPSRPLHSVVPNGYHSEYSEKVCDLHRHIDPEPHGVDHVIQSEDGELVAGNYDYEDGGIVLPADTAFIAHARNHWDELLDAAEERDRLRAALRRYGNHDDCYRAGVDACPRYDNDNGGDPSRPCTCGFSAALGKEAP